jgi:hypothetical protein
MWCGSDGADPMRVVLALGLLLALCASADAARAHHSKSRHVIIHEGRAFPWGSAVPGWAYAPLGSPLYRSYAAPRPDPYDDTPSYDDPSKFGG